MANYPTQLDEIDQWLADNFGIMSGACSSTENLRYNTARMIAEALWQKEQDHDACYQCEKNYDNVFFKGEQHAIKMMREEAIERTVKEDAGGYPYIDETELYDYDKDEPTAKKGDKVGVYIFKN